jgi:uncharacterized protein YhhL (DUF1145 family)
LIFTLTKALLATFWIAWILSLVSLVPDPYGQPVMWIGVALLVVHFLEFLLVRSKMTELQDGKTGFIETMVFGFGYWLPVLKRK